MSRKRRIRIKPRVQACGEEDVKDEIEEMEELLYLLIEIIINMKVNNLLGDLGDKYYEPS